VGVYYRPPDQEEEVDEAFYRQPKVASRSQALVLMAPCYLLERQHSQAHTVQEVPAEN